MSSPLQERQRAEQRALELRAQENAEKALRRAAGIPDPQSERNNKLEQERGRAMGRGGR